jgi:hypothetical protein
MHTGHTRCTASTGSKAASGEIMYHRMGCWDYPLDKNEYDMFMAQEVNGQKYHVH